MINPCHNPSQFDDVVILFSKKQARMIAVFKLLIKFKHPATCALSNCIILKGLRYYSPQKGILARARDCHGLPLLNKEGE